MPRWLYLWPLHFVEIGYIIFGAIFLLARERSDGKTKKADRVSIVAMVIQALAFAIAWTIARKHFTPFLPMVDWRVQYLVATLIVVLVIASLIFVMTAVPGGPPGSLRLGRSSSAARGGRRTTGRQLHGRRP